MPRTLRCRLLGLALAAALAGCQSVAPDVVPVSSASSLLGVDVRFPVPLGRDPTLLRVYLVRGPIHAGLETLPELVPATFVKGSRAYLLDPEPGTYSLVAVASDFAPPRDPEPIAGVPGTVSSGEDTGHLIVFPEVLIEQTRTTVAPGRAAFMGALRIREGDRIHGEATFQDGLQKRIAERIRPAAASRAGLGALFTLTWMVDLDASTQGRDAEDRESFLRAAHEDFGPSPWAEVVPEPASRRAAFTPAVAPQPPGPPEAPPAGSTLARPSAEGMPATRPVPLPDAPEAEPEVAYSPPLVPQPEPAYAPPLVPQPEPAAPSPQRPSLPSAAADTALAQLEIGMSDTEVRAILGEPDERGTYLTARAWIPFYTGADSQETRWRFNGLGQLRFVLDPATGILELREVVYEPGPSDD